LYYDTSHRQKGPPLYYDTSHRQKWPLLYYDTSHRQKWPLLYYDTSHRQKWPQLYYDMSHTKTCVPTFNLSWSWLMYMALKYFPWTNQYWAIVIKLLKETMEAFDGVQTHAWQESTKFELDVLPHQSYRNWSWVLI